MPNEVLHSGYHYDLETSKHPHLDIGYNKSDLKFP